MKVFGVVPIENVIGLAVLIALNIPLFLKLSTFFFGDRKTFHQAMKKSQFKRHSSFETWKAPTDDEVIYGIYSLTCILLIGIEVFIIINIIKFIS